MNGGSTYKVLRVGNNSKNKVLGSNEFSFVSNSGTFSTQSAKFCYDTPTQESFDTSMRVTSVNGLCCISFKEYMPLRPIVLYFSFNMLVFLPLMSIKS